MEHLNINAFSRLVCTSKPYAAAVLHGSDAYPQISGTVHFYEAPQGTLVAAEVFGLPRQVVEGDSTKDIGPFYAFHIHDGERCGFAGGANPFEASGMHYNPENQPHPYHAGDLPPLLANTGYAYSTVYTGRFTPQQVIGKTAIVHANADDFKTQPSGGAGLKLACGEITAAR